MCSHRWFNDYTTLLLLFINITNPYSCFCVHIACTKVGFFLDFRNGQTFLHSHAACFQKYILCYLNMPATKIFNNESKLNEILFLGLENLCLIIFSFL